MSVSETSKNAHDLRISGQRGVRIIPRKDSADEVVVDEHLDVDALPRRVAHAVYALLATPKMEHTCGPFKASEIVLYDGEAFSARQTGSALREARKMGLAEGWGGLWTASFISSAHYSDFEARYLRETAQEGEDD